MLLKRMLPTTASHRISRCIIAVLCMLSLTPEILALPLFYLEVQTPVGSKGSPFEENDSEKNKEEQNEDSKGDASKELSLERSSRHGVSKTRNITKLRFAHHSSKIPFANSNTFKYSHFQIDGSPSGSGIRQRC